MKLTFKIITIALLGLVIILLLIDIITGIWFWNGKYLIFNSSTFNNIATPIAQFIGVITFLVSLFLIYKQTNLLKNQNEILLSQNTKQFYEEQIKDYKEKINDYSKLYYVGNKEYVINPINFTKHLYNIFNKLLLDINYYSDIKNFQTNKMKETYYSNTNYYVFKEIFQSFTNGFTYNQIYSLHQKIKELINEINISNNLIDNDKNLLKKRIKREFLIDYIIYIENMRKQKAIKMKIPVSLTYSRFGGNTNYEYLFKSIDETDFAIDYDWFKNELE